MALRTAVGASWLGMEATSGPSRLTPSSRCKTWYGSRTTRSGAPAHCSVVRPINGLLAVRRACDLITPLRPPVREYSGGQARAMGNECSAIRPRSQGGMGVHLGPDFAEARLSGVRGVAVPPLASPNVSLRVGRLVTRNAS